MKVKFLGVGEACDPEYHNTSILVETTTGHDQIMLDCGFTVPHSYFSLVPDADELNGLWISHFHGDHFFGTPLLLLRLHEMGRKKSFLILGQKKISEKITDVMEMAYPGFVEKLSFSIEFLEVEPGDAIETAGFRWRSAESEHSARNLAVRLEAEGKSLFYSGDGRMTDATRALANGCDLAIHEAFCLQGDMSGHGSVERCIDFSEKISVSHIALVHLGRENRAEHAKTIREMISKVPGVHLFLPESGDEFQL